MKLLMSPASPFVRKARVVVRELGLTDRVAEVPISTSALNSDPTIVAANPIGKIPALVRDDGPAIYDSRVITRFLNDHAGGALYPQAQIWELLTLEATADAIMEAAVAMTYEIRLRPENERSPAWIEAQWAKASRGISAVNKMWMSHLNGPLNIGQIAIGCALSYVDLRHDARGWRNDNAALAAWHAEFMQRDSMIATAPA
ncbi:Glutathione S-transferase, N-terminal domain [Yoonia tamlensis]|uniref:Glutathione S-transferase, N-terminal domain n=1 Tax=Yoonia tamlensis TaxID=390270 RepID=A0A1I6HGL1_9RHOB|nr:glutathione S-transferase [Yoonia tamlensis]SFR53504.1 Glutathione S-transferase, N-terminal domain [Yoonia tamlensis]